MSIFPTKRSPEPVYRKKLTLSVVMLTCLLLLANQVDVQAQKADAKYAVKVVTERKNALYEMGDEVKFLVTVTRDSQPVESGKLDYVIDDEGPNQFERGSISLNGQPVTLTESMYKPGFLRCRVTFRTPDKKIISAVAEAGVSPLEIGLSLPVPKDFDMFWSDQKKQLSAVAMNPKLVSVKSPNENLECFDVKVNCLGGAPVSGYFARPKNAKPKTLPIVLWVHGAGVRSSSQGNAVTGASAKMLSMDINAHGIPNGEPAEFYRELSAGKLNNYRYVGRENREESYFRGMYLRLVRAIDFLTSQPEWDGKIVAVIGHSQGGGQSLVAGGIDDRVTFIAPGVPAICDHSGRASKRINGWPKLVPTGANGKPDAKILEASRYVDAVNFASRCKADAIMSVGFIDGVCPPTTCYAAYNQLQGKKQVINEPLMGHAAPAHIREAFFAAILKHVQEHQKN